MIHAIENQVEAHRALRLCPARVIAMSEDGQLANVAFLENNREQTSWAMIALRENLQAGDRVLISGEASDELYIIGILGAARERNKLLSKSGAGAKIHRDALGREQLQLHDAKGTVLFELDTETGVATVNVPGGDLLFNVPTGNIGFNVGGSVNMRSVGAVRISGNAGIELTAHAKHPQKISLDNQGARIAATNLNVESEKINVKTQDVEAIGDTVQTRFRQARWCFDKLETVVDRLFERTKNVFRRTEQLHQLEAGRVRMIVEEDYSLSSENTNIRAKQDVKIDGEHINLG